MEYASTSYGIGNSYSHYDVFINHRGPDVKKGLASHLYHRLIAHGGLKVFLDVEELQGGENLNPQIEGAIRTASVHIAIFSPGYAESSWCLNELLLMLESGSTIFPVFYHINPSELRWTLGANGQYARALRTHKQKKSVDAQTHQEKYRYDSSTIAKWREALSDVAEISGFELNACNGDEGQLVDQVVQQVLKKVSKTDLNVAKYPTGLHEKVEDLERTVLLQKQSGKARVVGIVGLGGVGKTTLAKEFFNRKRLNYDRSCFLSDVRENAAKSSLNSLQSILLKELCQLNVQINSIDKGIENLKRHLPTPHRVLIVLDDVDHIDQLDALFSPVKNTVHSDSLIVITSRNKDVFARSGIVESFIYEAKGLNRHHSRELFCSHAFDQLYPVEGFEQLVKGFLDACHGLPLSLKVIGALLYGKDLEYWVAQLHKISKILPGDILKRLKISYDSLDEEEKHIFLDIACFFIGQDRDTAMRIWDGSGWEGWLGFRNLENKCIVEVDHKNCIKMHDHLRDLGRDLAENEHTGRPLRIWRLSDNLLHNLSYQSRVRGISMVHKNGPEQSFESLAELVSSRNMRRLQLVRAVGDCVESIFSVAQSPQLVWLCWYSCPFSTLPSWISVKNLRVLHIEGEDLETLWQHESQAPRQLRELNIHANLLKEIPKSIGKLKHLEKFVLQFSWNNFTRHDLETLPDEFCHIHSLKHLELNCCRKMKLLPDLFGNLTNLQRMDLAGCSNLQMLPDSFGKLTNLRSINLSGCSTLQILPDSVGNLKNLRRINLGSCFTLQMLPDSVGKLTNLLGIDLSRCSTLQMLPDSVGSLTKLQHIDLGSCSALQMIPDSVGKLTNLQRINLFHCSQLQMLPDSVGKLTNLQSINLEGCCNLQKLPYSVGKLTNLQSINLEGCCNLQMLPDSVGCFKSIELVKRFNLVGCFNLQMLQDSLGKLTILQSIDLPGFSNLQMLPASYGNLTNLQRIELRGCSNLQKLPDSIGKLTNLQSIDLRGCSSLQMLPDSVGKLINLQSIDLGGCSTLQMLPDSVGNMTNLQRIDLSGCSSLQMLPDSIGKLANLQSIDLTGCTNLQMLPVLVGNLRNLQNVRLIGCSNLQMPPYAVGNLTNLQSCIDLYGWSNLQMHPDLVGNLTNRQSIDLRGCSVLEKKSIAMPRLKRLAAFAMSRFTRIAKCWKPN